MAIELSSPVWWFEGTHIRVGVLESSRVVVLVRTAVPTGDADLGSIFSPAERSFSNIDRAAYGLLIDVRLAPGRNDPEFEQRFEPHRQSLQRGFRRIAILVKSVSAKLQVQRYAAIDKIASSAFDDYGAALKWLEEGTRRP